APERQIPRRCGGPVTGSGSLLFAGSHNHGHLPAFHFWPHLNRCKFLKILFNPLHELHTDFLVCHLTATETDRDLAAVPVFKETYQVAEFYLIIPFFSSWTELKLFDLRLLLFLFGSRLRFLLVEDLLAVIHYLTDDRIGIRNLHQIKGSFFRHPEGFLDRYNPYLIAFGIDQADFSCVNILIDRRFWSTPIPIRSLFNNQISVLVLPLR